MWNALVDVLADPEYLVALATDYLASANSGVIPTIGNLERRLHVLSTEETNIVRGLARRGDLTDDVLRAALEEVKIEKETIEKELLRVQALREQTLLAGTIEEQVRSMATSARERLTNPTLELMAEVFDVLGIDLIRIDGHHYEGLGRLPLLTLETGEVSIKGPQRLFPNLTLLTPRVVFPISVRLELPRQGFTQVRC